MHLFFEKSVRESNNFIIVFLPKSHLLYNQVINKKFSTSAWRTWRQELVQPMIIQAGVLVLVDVEQERSISSVISDNPAKPKVNGWTDKKKTTQFEGV